jgi:lipopolysaccharide transport system permease protein
MKQWTEVITPRRKIFTNTFKDLIEFKDLMFLFVRRDFVAYYKQTILGPFWYILQPLMQTAVYSIMFGSIFNISSETGVPSMLFYLSGTVSWWYFSQSLIKTSNTFTENAHIFGKVYFPRLIVPISVLISNLIGFSIQFLLFIGIYIFFLFGSDADIHFNFTRLLLIPVLVLNMAVLGLAIGLIISSLTSKYKDFKQFIGFGVQLLMFASPVIIPMSIVIKRFPVWTHMLLKYNPMTPIIESFRAVFFGKYEYDFSNLYYSGGVALVLVFIGYVLFSKTEQNFMDTV